MEAAEGLGGSGFRPPEGFLAALTFAAFAAVEGPGPTESLRLRGLLVLGADSSGCSHLPRSAAENQYACSSPAGRAAAARPVQQGDVAIKIPWTPIQCAHLTFNLDKVSLRTATLLELRDHAYTAQRHFQQAWGTSAGSQPSCKTLTFPPRTPRRRFLRWPHAFRHQHRPSHKICFRFTHVGPFLAMCLISSATRDDDERNLMARTSFFKSLKTPGSAPFSRFRAQPQDRRRGDGRVQRSSRAHSLAVSRT